MLKKLSVKVGLLFFVFIFCIEVLLYFVLYVNLADERIDEVMANLLARGNTHSEVLEEHFTEQTLQHVSVMESASDFTVIVTDAGGRVLTYSDQVTPEMLETISHTDFNRFSETGSVVEDDWQKSRYIATDSPITIDGRHEGHVFMFAESASIREVVDYLRDQFLLIGLITIMATIIAIMLLSRLITRPLIKIKKATQQLTSEKTTVELDTRRHDELGELAGAITTLSADLNRLKNERNEFLASIAHELRTPLTYIKGYIDIASRPGTTAADTATYMNIIREEAIHLTGLVRNLFELAQMDQHEFAIDRQETELCGLIRSVTELVRSRFDQKGIRIEVDCQPGLSAFVDAKRFQQVLLNILDNALKHTPADGHVTVAAEYKDGIDIRITDDGEGIPAEDVPYVFDRLYRADKSRSRQNGGSGLGLAVAKEIIDAHNGKVSVESTLGKGTTVRIHLERGGNDEERTAGRR
ncbi:sensor histidine kinase [Indiicoccus explosivorum]|uniref:sensor histidine kinase n=1 Tax=Indiicoccus explosivorum TaxID=1917864 RepID=UPI000B43E2FA|nr:HAMP domain-containing sensor histidine kinase [Indiicoccus explosivorum]